MKSIVGILAMALVVNAFGSDLSKEAKAISASKTLYVLNIAPIKNAAFSISHIECDGGDTIDICVINVEVKEKKTTFPGSLSYKATFANYQLSSIEQVCPYCW